MSYTPVGGQGLASAPMDLLHDPAPGYEGVSKAFAMAKLLPTTHRLNLKLGLVHRGVLFASGQLDGYRQVSFFSDHLRQLGWREHLLGGDDEMHGCDMVFSHPADSAVARAEDPSFIRRSPVELWGSHAGEQ
jgi:hypothetical protein